MPITFIEWHEERMRELRYPPQVVAELRDARTKFLARQPRKVLSVYMELGPETASIEIETMDRIAGDPS